MPFILTPLLVGWFLARLEALPPQTAAMKADVARLVAAAEQRTGNWPRQAPPAVPEVTAVAIHGLPVVPLLMALLSDGPDAARDPKGWRVHQQVSLALCRIYAEPDHCGRTYCDGDPPERVRNIKPGWLTRIAADAAMRARPPSELAEQFTREPVFWRQMEIGRALGDTGAPGAIRALEALLTAEDRHVRGNAGFVLARLGDPRGFDLIVQILGDRSPRPAAQGSRGGGLRGIGEVGPVRVENSPSEIRSDRYYAAHLLGDLQDPRGVGVLVPLLDDPDVDYIVPWSLSQIGDSRAIGPLVEALERDDPSLRVLRIMALERLNAREALPRLRELLADERRSTFGTGLTVAEAARHAIAAVTP